MAIEYTWEVTSLKKTNSGDVVQTYWKKTGTDSANSEITGSFFGATPFTADPEAEGYIPFESLTEADVLGWIQGVVVGSYEEHVNAQIDKQINAVTTEEITGNTFPWST